MKRKNTGNCKAFCVSRKRKRGIEGMRNVARFWNIFSKDYPNYEVINEKPFGDYEI